MFAPRDLAVSRGVGDRAGGSVARPGLDVERRVVALAGGPRDVDVDAESRVRAVVAARAEHGFDLERVAAAQRHLQDILERLHGRDLVRPRPTLVVEVVGGDGVVRRGDARETSLALRLLLGRVLVGVPSEAQLAVRRLDTIQIAAVLVRNLEHDVRLVDRQGAARHGRSPRIAGRRHHADARRAAMTRGAAMKPTQPRERQREAKSRVSEINILYCCCALHTSHDLRLDVSSEGISRRR